MRLSAPTSKTTYSLKLAAADVLWAILAPFVALALREPKLVGYGGDIEMGVEIYTFALMTVACALPAFALLRINDFVGGVVSGRDVRRICAASLIAAVGSAALTFVVNRLDTVPRSTPLIYFVVLAIGLLILRAIGATGGQQVSAATPWRVETHVRRVILVGVDRFSSMVIRLTDCQTPRTIEIAAALDPQARLSGRTVNGVQIVGGPEDLRSVVEEYRVHGVGVDEVWVCDDLLSSSDRTKSSLVETCHAMGLKLSALSSALNLEPARSHAPWVVDSAAAAAAPLSGYFKFKRVFDIVAAAALMVVLSPIALIVAAIVAFDVGAPVIFWQERLGRGGRKFLLYKFRTYSAPFDRKGRPLVGDERLSKVGRFVRMTRLDEFPQLLNVLQGDMSLIGPRPLLPIDQPADPKTRLMVRPGVTGWAQVNGGNLVTPEEKDALDSWYIRHASIGLDLDIGLRTLAYFMQGERKGRSAIDEALTWRSKAREIDGRLFAEAAFAARPEPTPPLREPVNVSLH